MNALSVNLFVRSKSGIITGHFFVSGPTGAIHTHA